MGVVKFIWLMLCGICLSFLGALGVMTVNIFAGIVLFILMPLMYWCIYLGCRWFAEHSTPPISFFTESDIGMWFAHRFNPWLGATIIWGITATIIPMGLIASSESSNAASESIKTSTVTEQTVEHGPENPAPPEGGWDEDEGLSGE